MKTFLLKGLASIAFIFIFSLSHAQTGEALHFDGTNDHINAGNIAATNFGTGDFTIEFWINADPAGATNSDLVSKRDNCNCDNFFNIKLENDGRIFYEAMENTSCFKNTYVISTAAVDDNQWHHIAVIRTAFTISIYIDGVLDAAGYDPTASINNFANLTVGAGACSPFPWGDYYKGTMDDLKIWNYAKTAAQIIGDCNQQIAGNEPGLILNYNFNQGTVGAFNIAVNTALDISPNANNGALQSFAYLGATSNWVAGGPALCPDPTISLLDADGDGVPDITDPCSCGDPQNILDALGQPFWFHDFIEITSSPGETWEICTVNAGGLADASLIAYPLGTVIPEISPGVYYLDVWHYSNIGFDIDFCRTSGGAPFTLNESNVCDVNTCLTGPSVPTLSEWGIIIMTLLLLCFGTLVIGRRELAFAENGRNVGFDWNLPFEAKAFAQIMNGIVVIALIGFGLSFWIFGAITMVDIVGTAIAAPILAYLIYLFKITK